ncbi:MAG: DUF418 domain-containing protein [Acidobacteriota bacterium]
MRSTVASPAAYRIEYVDILRGFALVGVFGANLFIFSGLGYMPEARRALLPTARLDRVVQLLELIFIENKFLGLFAILFGVSFWLFLEGARARGESGDGRLSLFYRRLGWLFLIGALHGWLLWCFDVLRFYALWGLMLPLFLRVSQKALLRAALFFGVLAPAIVIGLRSLLFAVPAADVSLDLLALRAFSSRTYLDVLRANWRYDWKLTLSISQIAYQVAILGRLLLGLWAARAGVVSRLSEHRSLFRTVLLWGSLVGIVCNVLDARHVLDPSPAAGFLSAFAGRFAAEVGYLALSIAYASAVALLVQKSRGPERLRALGSVGRMALSLYIFQTMIGLFLFYGFTRGPRLMGRIGPTWLLPIWIGGYGLQLWLASAWLRRYRFGPAEWLWRSLTYARIQPLRIRR